MLTITPDRFPGNHQPRRIAPAPPPPAPELRGEEPWYRSDEAKKTPVKLRPRRARRFVFGVIALFLLAVIGVSSYGAGVLVYGLNRTRLAGEKAQVTATDLDFAGTLTALDEAQAGLAQANSGLRVLAFWKPVPYVGDQVEAFELLVGAGQEALSALREAVVIAEDVFGVITKAQELIDPSSSGQTTSFADLPHEVKADLLRTLHNHYSSLKRASVELRLVEQKLDALDDLAVLPVLKSAILPVRERLPELINGIDLLVPFAATVGELTGVDADKQWLILFENNSELRPGGGFLGNYGLVVVRDGELKSLFVDDTYAVDRLVAQTAYHVNPPAPMTTFLQLNSWYFRDGNWSPDFPESAKTSAQLLRQELSYAGKSVPEISGVIGFTPTFAEWLLELLGPTTVDGVTFDHENIRHALEFEVEFAYVGKDIPRDERKKIVSHLADVVVADLMHLPSDKWDDLFALVKRGFREKQIHLYAYDPETQAAFEDSGWAGQIDPTGTDDALMFVDSNMAALKTDDVMLRSINYSIKPDAQGGYQTTASLTYRNNGSFTPTTSRYRTWVRVFAPAGSEFISVDGSLRNDLAHNPEQAPGNVLTENELGLTSFGTFTSIEPGAEKTVTFTYRLPQSTTEAIKQGYYELKVWKQLGALNYPLTLDLDFGKNIKRATPSEERSEWGDRRYKVKSTLDQDLNFSIQF